MEAELMAIGPFSDEVLVYLDYSPWHYAGVKDGDTVVTTVVRCRTSEASSDLATALGVGSMELGKHVFQSLTEDQRRELMKFCYGIGARAADCYTEAIDALARSGQWMFIYRPHG